MYTQSVLRPAQSVYLYVYVLVPSHVNGSGESTVDTSVAVIGAPHTSVTVGVVGAVALARHSTVFDPLAGMTTGCVI